jgi:hypothetical protein
MPVWSANEYYYARHEHAFLLRCEGLKLAEIGQRLGVGKERARTLIIQFIRRYHKCNPRTRFRWEVDLYVND